jgi:hypothetical protein
MTSFHQQVRFESKQPVWPRHFLLKCLHQAMKLCSRFRLCFDILLAFFFFFLRSTLSLFRQIFNRFRNCSTVCSPVHCIVCTSSNYVFWQPLCYLQTLSCWWWKPSAIADRPWLFCRHRISRYEIEIKINMNKNIYIHLNFVDICC